MNPLLTVLGLLSVGVPSTRVVIPLGDTPEVCLANEQVAAVMAHTLGVRVLRHRPTGHGSLARALEETGATFGVTGKVVPTSGERGRQLELTVVRAAGSTDRASDRYGPTTVVSEMLARLFPEIADRLASDALAAPNQEALEAFCRGDHSAALKASGAAPFGAVTTAGPGPGERSRGGPRARIAAARAAMRLGKYREAASILGPTLDALRNGARVPDWRAVPDAPARTALTLTQDRVIAFGGGLFTGLDRATGRPLWRFDAGTAEPRAVEIEPRLVLVIGTDEVFAVETRDGRLRWKAELKAPMPEIVRAPGRIVVGGTEEIRALDPKDGRVLWTFDPRLDVTAGPVAVGSDVVAAAGTKVFLLRGADGRLLKTTDLGDEIASPLIATSSAKVWAMIGSDEVKLFEPKAGLVEAHIRTLRGADGRATSVKSRLFVPTTRRRTSAIAVLDPTVKNGVEGSIGGAVGPVVEVKDLGVVFRDDRRRTIARQDNLKKAVWRATFKDPIVELTTRGRTVFAASGRHLHFLEDARGQTKGTLELDEPIATFAVDDLGGAVLVRGGAVYGFTSSSDPNHPPSHVPLDEAELLLAECHERLGSPARAIAAARGVLERTPENLEALTILARAEEKMGSSTAVARWHAVAVATVEHEPLGAEATLALDRLAGLRRVANPGAPVVDVLVASDRLVLRTEREVLGLTPSADGIGWRMPGTAAHPASSGFVLVDRQLVDVVRGSPRKAPPLPDGTTYFDDGAIRIEGGRSLISERPDGTRRFSVSLRNPKTKLLAAGQGVIVLATDKTTDRATGKATTEIEAQSEAETKTELEIEIEALDASSGKSLWQRLLPGPQAQPIRRVALGTEAVLLATSAGLVALGRTSGDVLFEEGMSLQDDVRLSLTPVGWLVIHATRARLLDASTGQVRHDVALPAKPHDVALVPDAAHPVAMLALADGLLLALDLSRGTIRGRLTVGPIRKLAAHAGRVAVLLESGDMFEAIGARALARAR